MQNQLAMLSRREEREKKEKEERGERKEESSWDLPSLLKLEFELGAAAVVRFGRSHRSRHCCSTRRTTCSSRRRFLDRAA